MASKDNLVEAAISKKKRGRPKRSVNPDAPSFGPTSYNGPSPNDIMAWSDRQVAESFEALDIEPSPSVRWRDDDPEWNLALWWDDVTDGEQPGRSTPHALSRMKAKHDEWLSKVHRTQLAYEYIRQWCESLEHSDLISEVERMEGKTFTKSELRYAETGTMAWQLAETVYAKLMMERKSTHV